MEKVIQKKGNKLYVKRKSYDNSFNSLTDKKDIVKWIYIKLNQCFPKPCEPFGGDMQPKADLKNMQQELISQLVLKSNLVKLKVEICEIDKLFLLI